MRTPHTVVFLDLETLGLEPNAPIWEIGAVRVSYSFDSLDESGELTMAETEEYQAFIQHKPTYHLHTLPQKFRVDYATRYDPEKAQTRQQIQHDLRLLFRKEGSDKAPSIAGAVINFDTERLVGHGLAPSSPGLLWHYHLIDVEALTAGFLAAQDNAPEGPPWNSNDLSRAIGIDPDSIHTHQALEDAHWARMLYERIVLGMIPEMPRPR